MSRLIIDENADLIMTNVLYHGKWELLCIKYSRSLWTDSVLSHCKKTAGGDVIISNIADLYRLSLSPLPLSLFLSFVLYPHCLLSSHLLSCFFVPLISLPLSVSSLLISSTCVLSSPALFCLLSSITHYHSLLPPHLSTVTCCSAEGSLR